MPQTAVALQARDRKPGMFWTWQDAQIEDEALVRASVDDIADHGFGTVLVQPRGCRFPLDGAAFIRAAAHACRCAHDRDLAFWLHLDPRSMARPLIDAAGEAAEYLVVAGTGDQPAASLRHRRALDTEAAVAPDGAFRVRLDHPTTRPHHVHSDGALAFWPLRLERCLVFRRDALGIVEMATVEDVTGSAELFASELSGYVEVFGRVPPRDGAGWCALALVAFGSNYPDFAGPATRAALRAVLDRYAAAGAALDGLWWDEPGYCTGFDRAFRADRGRIPWGANLARLYRQQHGRAPIDDALYLLCETDDGRWGARREAYYRMVQTAVLGAQADLTEHMHATLGSHARIGVHQTWHQNADDVIHGSMDWWRGAELLGAGFTDVGSAERIDDPRQMAEVTALATIAASLGRHSARREAYYNLWGVDYGEDGTVPGPGIVDWWVDLQATLGCNWLAHTYGPTGYFERPSVWGPGYPDHPTWPYLRQATARLAQTLELANGALPTADVALVYPLGTLYRLASDLANPLAHGALALIDTLTRAGFELDVVSPEVLRQAAPDRYRAVIWLHPFGAAPADVEDLGRRVAAGVAVAAAGLPAVAGEAYAGADAWREHLGLAVPELSAAELFGVHELRGVAPASDWAYLGLAGWGRPTWRDSDGSNVGYLGLLLEGLGDEAPVRLSRMGVEPGWRVPSGALATRTRLSDGATLVRICPARFARPFHGSLHAGELEIALADGAGLTCFVVGPDGDVHCEIAARGLEWAVNGGGAAP